MWHIYWHKVSWNKIICVSFDNTEVQVYSGHYVSRNCWKNIELNTKLTLVFMKLESQMEIVRLKPIRLHCLGCHSLDFNAKMGLQTLNQWAWPAKRNLLFYWIFNNNNKKACFFKIHVSWNLYLFLRLPKHSSIYNKNIGYHYNEIILITFEITKPVKGRIFSVSTHRTLEVYVRLINLPSYSYICQQ